MKNKNNEDEKLGFFFKLKLRYLKYQVLAPSASEVSKQVAQNRLDSLKVILPLCAHGYLIANIVQASFSRNTESTVYYLFVITILVIISIILLLYLNKSKYISLLLGFLIEINTFLISYIIPQFISYTRFNENTTTILIAILTYPLIYYLIKVRFINKLK